MRLSPRVLGFVSTLLSLLSGAVYNIAITRKLTLDYLGLLNIVNAAVAFSSLPVAIPSFTVTRSVAKDGSIDLINSFKLISVFYVISALMSMAYLVPLWSEAGGSAFLILVITLLTALMSYIQSITNAALLVKNRSAFIGSSIINSMAKLSVIPLIMALNWSIEAVLWSTFIIVLVSAVYALIKTVPLHRASMGFRAMFRWALSASWVSMMNSIADTISSLSTEVIGLLGTLIDLGVWNVLRAIGRLFTMPNVIPSIMYGELLERNRVEVAYRDMFLSLFINTAIVLTVAGFEPLIIDLLRPNDLNLIGPLFLPILLFLISNTVSLINTFTDSLISGVDRVDFKGEINPGTYWGSHIGFSKMLHLVRASIYIVLAIPIFYMIRGLPFAIVMAFSISNIIGFSVSFTLRMIRIRRMRIDFPASHLLIDYVAPTLVSAAAIYLVTLYLRFKLVHDVYVTLAEIVIAFLVSTLVYLAITLLISKRSRDLFRMIMRSLRLMLASSP